MKPCGQITFAHSRTSRLLENLVFIFMFLASLLLRGYQAEVAPLRISLENSTDNCIYNEAGWQTGRVPVVNIDVGSSVTFHILGDSVSRLMLTKNTFRATVAMVYRGAYLGARQYS